MPLTLVPRTPFLGRVRDGESLMPSGIRRGVSGLQVLTRIPKGHSLGRVLKGGTPSNKRRSRRRIWSLLCAVTLLATYNRALLPFPDFSSRYAALTIFRLATGFASLRLCGKGTPTMKVGEVCPQSLFVRLRPLRATELETRKLALSLSFPRTERVKFGTMKLSEEGKRVWPYTG